MTTKDLALRFRKSAEKVFKDGDFTSATILYFKTWFAIQDYFLLKELGMSPKDHGERFRILEKQYPEDYKKLDKEFSTYRDTYTHGQNLLSNSCPFVIVKGTFITQT